MLATLVVPWARPLSKKLYGPPPSVNVELDELTISEAGDPLRPRLSSWSPGIMLELLFGRVNSPSSVARLEPEPLFTSWRGAPLPLRVLFSCASSEKIRGLAAGSRSR